MYDAGRALLAKAASDLKALQHMQDTFALDEHVFGFHAQHACEKALKAWLLHLGIEPPFIHDLRRLIALLSAAGQVVDDATEVDALTVYAVGLRYDEAPPGALLDRPATVALCERPYARVAGLSEPGREKR